MPSEFAADITGQSLIDLLAKNTNILFTLSANKTMLNTLAPEFSLILPPPSTPLISHFPKRDTPASVVPIDIPKSDPILSSTSAPIWFSGIPQALKSSSPVSGPYSVRSTGELCFRCDLGRWRVRAGRRGRQGRRMSLGGQPNVRRDCSVTSFSRKKYHPVSNLAMRISPTAVSSPSKNRSFYESKTPRTISSTKTSQLEPHSDIDDLQLEFTAQPKRSYRPSARIRIPREILGHVPCA